MEELLEDIKNYLPFYNFYKHSPLMYAVSKQHISLVRLFIENGCIFKGNARNQQY